VVVVVVAVGAGVFPYRALGLADPGADVRIGAPLLRLVVDGATTVCTGAVVFAAFFTRPQTVAPGRLTPPR
jgi:putative copper resistance protein D